MQPLVGLVELSARKLATQVAPEWPGGHKVRLRGLGAAESQAMQPLVVDLDAASTAVYTSVMERRPRVAWRPSAGCSAVRLAHMVRDDEVAGSNPATPTTASIQY